MTGARCLVFALVVYALADACLLDLPGVFVFDADDSAEVLLAGSTGPAAHRRIAVVSKSTRPAPVRVPLTDERASEADATRVERIIEPMTRFSRLRLYPPASIEDPYSSSLTAPASPAV